LSTASPVDQLEPQLADYIRRGILVFPCRGKHQPLVRGGFYAASRDPKLVLSWWQRWPDAWVVVRTGAKPSGSGVAILDVDPEHGGFDTLAQLVGPEIPKVPRVMSPSGGEHQWYLAPAPGCFSTVGAGGKRRRGLGPGLDLKCDLSQCHAPGGSPRSPYHWDELYNLNTVPLSPLPAALTPVEVPEDELEATAQAMPQRPVARPDAYGETALKNACERIRNAVPGTQRHTLNAEAFAMGKLAAGLGLDHAWVIKELIEAGMSMQQQAGRAPWRRHEVRDVVTTAFRDGLRHPYTPQRRSR
jgi:hypothetical protein